jgi:hypothetical protein
MSIEKLQTELEIYPGIKISPIFTKTGYICDIEYKHKYIIAQWDEQFKFGLTCCDNTVDYGIGCDELYNTIEEVIDKIKDIIDNDKTTSRD